MLNITKKQEGAALTVELVAAGLAERVAHEEQIVALGEVAVVDTVALGVALHRRRHRGGDAE